MNKIFLCLLLLTSCAAATPQEARDPAQYSKKELDGLWNGESHKTRKMVTSNSVHYWAWSQNEADHFLRGYLDATGVVMGDPHLKNVFDYRSRNSKAELAIADIDDSGRGPLFLDFARYVIYIKSAEIPVKIKDLLGAYLDGMAGLKNITSSLMQEAQNVSQKDIEAKHAKYLMKHAPDGFLANDDLGLIPESGFTPEQKAEVKTLKPQVMRVSGFRKIYSVGYKADEGGNSKGMDRYWFVVGTDKVPMRLFEAKEQSRPALDYYSPQLDAAPRIKEVTRYYSERGLDPKVFNVISGKKSYWFRARKWEALDLDDKEITDQELADFSLYMAQWMGRMAGRQPSGKFLRKKLNEDVKQTKDDLETYVRTYMAEMEKINAK